MSDIQSFDDDISVTMLRDEFSVIRSVGPEMRAVLGWEPEEMVGRPSTEFVHPEDQPGAIATWFEMMDAPGQARTWEGRYRTKDGYWRWVRSVNVNRLDDPEAPAVETTLRGIEVAHVDLAEELRAREQVLSRLSDAMPIGVFEMGTDGQVGFSNERLDAILGVPSATTVQDKFSIVVDEDRPLLDAALRRVLADEGVDDVELRLRPSGTAPSAERVCVLSMRPLTDGAGRVTGAVGCLVDVTEQVQLRRQLELRATTDQLTSCLNRAAILEVLASAVEREGAPHGLAVVFVDLCRFKEVNDRYGHAAGDDVLELAATRLHHVVRDGDRVGRVGGDEFLVVCPGVDSESVALEIAERIRVALTDCVELEGGSVDLLASIGVAWSTETLDADTLVRRADEAMYRAKRSGSSAVEVFAGKAR